MLQGTPGMMGPDFWLQELKGTQNPAIAVSRSHEYKVRQHLKNIRYEGRSAWEWVHEKVVKDKATNLEESAQRIEFYLKHWQLFELIITCRKKIIDDRLAQLRKEV